MRYLWLLLHGLMLLYACVIGKARLKLAYELYIHTSFYFNFSSGASDKSSANQETIFIKHPSKYKDHSSRAPIFFGNTLPYYGGL